MSKKQELSKAKKNKIDEFYTFEEDIVCEMQHYVHHFEGKTIFLNCDNPKESNFYKYFSENFRSLKLKMLLCLFHSINGDEKPYYTEYDGNTEKIASVSSGDFRGEESIRLLQRSDVIISNPPFSLFREYVSLLEKYEKKFLIIGNQNAISYREVFKMIMKGNLFLGVSKPKGFSIPNDYPLNTKQLGTDRFGRRKIMLNGTVWMTNMEHGKRKSVQMYRQYDEKEYQKYEGFNAIEVPKVSEIPMGYDGIIGVPVTFMDKYNPNQFEILGAELFWDIETSDGIFQRPTHRLQNGREVYKRIWIRHKKNGK